MFQPNDGFPVGFSLLRKQIPAFQILVKRAYMCSNEQILRYGRARTRTAKADCTMSLSQPDEMASAPKPRTACGSQHDALRRNSDRWKDGHSCGELRSSERQHTHLMPHGFKCREIGNIELRFEDHHGEPTSSARPSGHCRQARSEEHTSEL